MSKKKTLIALISVAVLIAVQIYFLSTYDHFKAEGGLHIEMKVTPQDVTQKYARASSNFDTVMEDAVQTFKSKGGDFLSVFSESNKKVLRQPLVQLFNYREISELSIESKDEEVIEFLREYLNDNLEFTTNAFKNRMERIFNREVIASNDAEALKISLMVVGQHDTVIEPENLHFPEVDLGFYECANISEFGNNWHSLCLMSEPEPIPDSIQALTNLNQSSANQKQTLVSTVQWVNGNMAMVSDKDKNFVDKWINSEEARELFNKNFAFRWSASSTRNGGGQVWYLYIIKNPKDGVPMIANEDIKSATFDNGQGGNMARVDLMMTQEGSQKWARMTEENIGRCVAMCVNDKVYSAPQVINAIMDGRTQISGGDVQNLKDIEIAMNTKTLEIYPSGDVDLTLKKGDPPILNALIQKILLGLSALLTLFLIVRLFTKSPKSSIE